MCADGDHHDTGRSMPRPVEGEAIDPIALEPVDELTITTLVDNSYDALLVDDGPARRKGFAAAPTVPAATFDGGVTYPGLRAEHGFSALVSIRRGEETHTLLYDTGISPGLVVLSGCGHAGIVNIARHAMRLTGVDRLHGLVGGFHLSGPGFEPVIGPTVEALRALGPGLLVAGHCSGWKAQHQIAAALPGAFVPNAVGTSFTLAAA